MTTSGHPFGPAAGAQAAETQLAELYAQVPDVRCKGLCAEACGPIGMSTTERDRIARVHGLRIEHAATKPGTVDCPALQDDRCTVYADRPMICRLWGAIPAMPCPHGCTPRDGHIPTAYGAALLRASITAGGQPPSASVPSTPRSAT